MPGCSKYTVRTLRRTIPASVPGIHFLSGGQSPPSVWVYICCQVLEQQHVLSAGADYHTCVPVEHTTAAVVELGHA